MKKFKYKCSGGNGDYYKGEINSESIEIAYKELTIRYHNILLLEEIRPNKNIFKIQ